MLHLSHHFLGKRGIGCISISPSLKRLDYQFAIEYCSKQGIALEVVETKELHDENYWSNPANRCYFCKSHLYETLNHVRGKYPDYDLLNGTNTDDLGDYRPGLEAAREHAIKSPLLDCGIDKNKVRALAKYFDLPNWQKPASPCLSSRIPYGEIITPDKLSQVEQAEKILSNYGLPHCRVRHYGTEARLEVPDQQIDHLKNQFEVIDREIRALGFSSCTIDEEGFVSGKLNRTLST